MKYVTQMGVLYKMSNRSWQKLCQDGKEGNIAGSFDDYGAVKIAYDVESITDWEADDFDLALRIATYDPWRKQSPHINPSGYIPPGDFQ